MTEIRWRIEEMNQQNDRVIKVKQVFQYIRKYIVVVIICAICGVVGLAGLCYLKNKRAIKSEVAQTPVKLEALYEDFRIRRERISHMRYILMNALQVWNNI